MTVIPAGRNELLLAVNPPLLALIQSTDLSRVAPIRFSINIEGIDRFHI